MLGRVGSFPMTPQEFSQPERIYIQKGTGRTIYTIEGAFIVSYWFAHAPQSQFSMSSLEFKKWLAENNYYCLN